jgi:hypothetical protein
MLKREPLLKAFEKAQIRNSKSDYFKHLRIFEALYEEAKHSSGYGAKCSNNFSKEDHENTKT